MENLLDKAIIIAVKAHSGQLDKAGAPYILHPLRVMLDLKNENERIVGILHDVLEDTDITIEYLKNNGFKDEREILEALISVTKNESENYDEFIQRVKLNPIGIKVKLADLKDNMDIARISNPTEKDHKRVEKYRGAKEILLSE